MTGTRQHPSLATAQRGTHGDFFTSQKQINERVKSAVPAVFVIFNNFLPCHYVKHLQNTGVDTLKKNKMIAVSGKSMSEKRCLAQENARNSPVTKLLSKVPFEGMDNK